MKWLCPSLPALAVLLLTSLAVAGMAAEPMFEKRELDGVKNYTRMESAVSFAGSTAGFGGATRPSAMAGLRGQGFASVINLRLADEEGMDVAASEQGADSAGLNYYHLPLDPNNLEPGTIEKVLATMADPANQPTYIHCNSATRAAAVWMIGRVLKDNRSHQAAEQEARQIAKDPDKAVGFATAYMK